MNTLVIVESPTKAKTIEKFLGKSYTVRSSMGHVRDLPKSDLGVDVSNGFAPHYVTIRGKGDTIKAIKDAAKKADRVLLASDPDREGEAIAWHLKQYLKIDNENCRIEFNEITDSAVKKAVKTPHPIDMDRVEAQQARRILDRLVGYKISPILWKKVKKGLSAGRVQSVAVRLICDREEEIKSFVPEEYWLLLAELAAGKDRLTVKLAKIAGKKAKIANKEALDKILAYLAEQQYIVSAVTAKEKQKPAPPPFTTSGLQQEANRRLSMMAKKTMKTAQELYEGINVAGQVTGLITYMRTDSVRISDEAQAAAREFILNKYGADFVPHKPNVFAVKGKIQNAHEAIRPTSVERTPLSLKPYLSAQQYKLYKLIWERFVASQMSNAVYDVTTIEVEAGNCLFRASGEVLKFAGFTQVYAENKEENDKDEFDGVLAPVTQGQKLDFIKHLPSQRFTQPPARYGEASLVKALEELGIGRPSTYAPIIDTILARGYVVREEKVFFPTELGTVVVDLLKEHFKDIIDVEFTADMERNLDLVEEGEMAWAKVLADFYGPFSLTLENAEEQISKVQIAPEESGDICELCSKPMVYRMGRYGRFLACSGFPECRNTKPIVTATNVKCLACGGQIVQRKSRSGRLFYGCDHYPECKYISWDLPVEELCPACGTQLAQKTFRGGKSQLVCPNSDCPTNENKKVKKAVKKEEKPAAAKKTTGKKTGKTTTSKKAAKKQ
ncbi:MAG: type I DNA topoisomerase [Clostridia bacterium]|nr:type I DNA topoisomerase [Clostridia bacterium]